MKNMAIIFVILTIIVGTKYIALSQVVNGIEVPIVIILSLLGIGLLGIMHIFKRPV